MEEQLQPVDKMNYILYSIFYFFLTSSIGGDNYNEASLVFRR
jgi:hypothetical protein